MAGKLINSKELEGTTLVQQVEQPDLLSGKSLMNKVSFFDR